MTRTVTFAVEGGRAVDGLPAASAGPSAVPPAAYADRIVAFIAAHRLRRPELRLQLARHVR